MKAACHTAFLIFFHLSLFAQQYYVRGEVKDEAGNILQNVTILQHKTGYLFRSGYTGTFGIVANQQIDTFSFSMEGYRIQKLEVDADQYVKVQLKPLPASALKTRRDKLSSQTRNLEKEEQGN